MGGSAVGHKITIVKAAPCKEALLAETVGLAGLGPVVRLIDRRVTVHIGTILLCEAVHTIALLGSTE